MKMYTFRTTKSWQINMEGENPEQAYIKAKNKLKNGTINFKQIFGELLDVYAEYDKKGIVPLEAFKKLK